MAAAATPQKGREAIAMINANGSGYHVLPISGATLNLAPGARLPDGARIAVAGWDDSNPSRNGIYTVNAAGGGAPLRVSASPDGHLEYPLAYSANGSRLLFFHERAAGMGNSWGNLLVVKPNGSGRTRLNPPGTRVNACCESPGSWSPGGGAVAFTAFSAPSNVGSTDNAGWSAVFVVDVNGSHRRRITAWGQWSTTAQWSPDGKWIVFDKVVSENGNHNLFVVHPDGTGLRAITSTAHGYGSWCAQWSPDGNKLLFERSPSGSSLTSLWIVNPGGSGLIQLTRSGVDSAGSSWGLFPKTASASRHGERQKPP